MFSALSSPSPTVLHLSVFSCPLLLPTPHLGGTGLFVLIPNIFKAKGIQRRGFSKSRGVGWWADEKANWQGQKDWDTQALATTQAQRFSPRLLCLNHTL